MVDSVAIIGVGDMLELIIRDLVAERERHRTVCSSVTVTSSGE